MALQTVNRKIRLDLRTISRKVRMDLLTEDGDICEILFQYPQTQKACRLFLNELKRRGSFTRQELNRFAWNLKNGKIEPNFNYSRDRFYGTIRKTLLTLGLITIATRAITPGEFDDFDDPERKRRKRDTIEIYVPVLQPIKKRPPDGLSFVRLSWILCKKWNDEFSNLFMAWGLPPERLGLKDNGEKDATQAVAR